MEIAPAFFQLGSSAIENEIRCCFPDTALYHRLCWGGFERCKDYIHQEFSPEPWIAEAKLTSTFRSSELFPAGGETKCSSLPPQAYLPVKRRKTSLVEQLEKGIRSMEAVYVKSTTSYDKLEQAGRSSSLTSSPHDSHNSSPAPDSTLKRAPFAVSCETCRTRIVSAFPCYVIKGHIVLWAESVLGVRCVPKKPLTNTTASAAGPLPVTQGSDQAKAEEIGKQSEQFTVSSTSSVTSSSSLSPRGLLRRFTDDLTPSAQPVSAFADAGIADSVRQQKLGKKQSSHKTNGASTSVPDKSQCQSLVLHSLHIVSDGVVRNLRLASYTLQSVLQPGCPTALECYPRHMIHFGLLCFAAWRASTEVWGDLMESNTEGKTNNKKSQSSSSSANLLPHAADDAVLVLGLGGNVLGQCLDAILPPAVPLHVVEVEPAVLQACEQHYQFPRCCCQDIMNDLRGLNKAPQEGKRATKSSTKISTQQAVEDAPLSTDVWGKAAELINTKAGTSMVFRSLRQLNYEAGLASSSTTSIVKEASPQSEAHAKHEVPRETSTRKRSSRVTSTEKVPRDAALQFAEPRGEYLCVLQDVYAFLQGVPDCCTRKEITSTVAQPSYSKPTRCPRRSVKARAVIKRSEISRYPSAFACNIKSEQDEVKKGIVKSTTQLSVPTVMSVTPAQYSMIFLDCYDPDREHMMHEGGLIDLCVRRLQPGGVLLVNAHVLPSVVNLKRDVLSRGFVTVQALRVAGCTQTVLVCVAPDADPGKRESRARQHGHTMEEKCARFTVLQLQQLAHRLNAACVNQASSFGERNDAKSLISAQAFLRSNFQLDASWLKSCRRTTVALKNSGDTTRDLTRAPHVNQKESGMKIDFRIWQHYV